MVGVVSFGIEKLGVLMQPSLCLLRNSYLMTGQKHVVDGLICQLLWSGLEYGWKMDMG